MMSFYIFVLIWFFTVLLFWLGCLVDISLKLLKVTLTNTIGPLKIIILLYSKKTNNWYPQTS